MKGMIGMSLLFFLLLLAPFVFAITYFYKKKGTILQIHPQNARDARYFGKSFAEMVEKNLPSMQGNEITLSQKESILDGDQEIISGKEVERMVICRKKDFVPGRSVQKFSKEVYCAEAAKILGNGCSIRALYGKKKILLGENTRILRWVDTEETLAVYENCDLGHSASAGHKMSVGEGCKFKRLYAPEILLGQYPEEELDLMKSKDPRIFRMPIPTEVEKNMRYISREMINEEGVVNFSILSWRNVTVIENVIVQGDVRSHRGVRLCDQAVVCGNVFAEKDIYLGRNATVLGNVFTQGNIYLEEGSMVGQRGRICSVIARETITFEKHTCVFGYVSCEKGGTVIKRAEKNKEKKREDFRFLSWEQQERALTFRNLFDYENVDQQGFRKDVGIFSVQIPKGALAVRESMFFQCRQLKTVIFPLSLQRIGAYAFADCENLKEMHHLELTEVTEIQTSAFENCRQLERICFPKSLRYLAGASFAGCERLQEVVFAKDSVIETLGDHCFRGCKAIRKLEIPDSVKYIGVSCFVDCEQLEEILIPYSCRQERGVLQLQQERGVTVIVKNIPLCEEMG